MLQTNVDARARQRPSATHADSKRKARGFGRYKDETARRVRQADVKKDSVLQQLVDAWREFKPSDDNSCETISQRIRDITYNSKNVERFSLTLVEFQDEPDFSSKMGLFMSLLVNNCTDTEFVIHTENLTHLPDHLGLNNTKNITVIGDVGRFLGMGMQGGAIRVIGNAGRDLGFAMQDGKIIIDGDVDWFAGHCMKGGEIHIEGDIGPNAGLNTRGGQIFHQGEQIWPEK